MQVPRHSASCLLLLLLMLLLLTVGAAALHLLALKSVKQLVSTLSAEDIASLGDLAQQRQSACQ